MPANRYIVFEDGVFVSESGQIGLGTTDFGQKLNLKDNIGFGTVQIVPDALHNTMSFKTEGHENNVFGVGGTNIVGIQTDSDLYLTSQMASASTLELNFSGWTGIHTIYYPSDTPDFKLVNIINATGQDVGVGIDGGGTSITVSAGSNATIFAYDGAFKDTYAGYNLIGGSQFSALDAFDGRMSLLSANVEAENSYDLTVTEATFTGVGTSKRTGQYFHAYWQDPSNALTDDDDVTFLSFARAHWGVRGIIMQPYTLSTNHHEFAGWLHVGDGDGVSTYAAHQHCASVVRDVLCRPSDDFRISGYVYGRGSAGMCGVGVIVSNITDTRNGNSKGYQAMVDSGSGNRLILRRDYVNTIATTSNYTGNYSMDTWYWNELEWKEDGTFISRTYDERNGTLLDSITGIDTTYDYGYAAFSYLNASAFDEMHVEGSRCDFDYQTPNIQYSDEGFRLGLDQMKGSAWELQDINNATHIKTTGTGSASITVIWDMGINYPLGKLWTGLGYGGNLDEVLVEGSHDGLNWHDALTSAHPSTTYNSSFAWESLNELTNSLSDEYFRYYRLSITTTQENPATPGICEIGVYSLRANYGGWEFFEQREPSNSGYSEYVAFTDISSSLGAYYDNGVVHGIEVIIQKQKHIPWKGDDMTDDSVVLTNDGATPSLTYTTDKATATKYLDNGEYIEEVYGGPNDTWGFSTTATLADFKDTNFGVLYSANFNRSYKSESKPAIRHIKIKLYHTNGTP